MRPTREPLKSDASQRGRQRSVAEVAETRRFRASAKYAHWLSHDTTEPRGAKCDDHVFKLMLQ